MFAGFTELKCSFPKPLADTPAFLMTPELFINISVLGKEYYKMFNIYGVRLSVTSNCITIVHRHIFHFYQEECLGMFFNKDSFAFLAILFLITL